MDIENLVGRFRLIDKELRNKIDEDDDLDIIRGLDHQINDLMTEIREYQPDSLATLRTKLGFFVSFLEREGGPGNSVFAIKALVDVVNRDIPGNALAGFVETQRNAGSVSEQVFTELDSFKSMSALDLVNNSHERISIIDRDFRYVATSQKNGEFYDLDPDQIFGRHVGEIIGEIRFHSRAKRFLEKTFDRNRQYYFHTLDTENGERIMSCEMLPLITAEDEVIGSLVSMNDVSDMILDPNCVRLESE